MIGSAESVVEATFLTGGTVASGVMIGSAESVVEATVLSGATVSDCDWQMISVLAIAVPMRVDAQIGTGIGDFSSWATEACKGVRALDQRDEELVDISRVRRVYWCCDSRQKTLDGLLPHGSAGGLDSGACSSAACLPQLC